MLRKVINIINVRSPGAGFYSHPYFGLITAGITTNTGGSRNKCCGKKAIGATKSVEECTRKPLKGCNPPAAKLQKDKPAVPSQSVMTKRTIHDCNPTDEVHLKSYPAAEEETIPLFPGEELDLEPACDEPHLMGSCPQPRCDWSEGCKQGKYTLRLLIGILFAAGTLFSLHDELLPEVIYTIPSLEK